MPTIQNTVKDSAGNLLNGQTVIDLIIFPTADAPVSFQGFVDLGNVNTDYTINRDAAVAIVNGGWTATIRGNAAIEDAYGGTVTTYYKISETCNGITRTYYIIAPNNTNTYWVGDLIAVDPQTFSISVTLDSISDVDATTPANGDILQFNSSTGHWTATNIPALTGGTQKDVFTFSAPGTLTPVSGTMAIGIPFAYTVNKVMLHAGTAPQGGTIFCDVNVDGTTIFTSGADRRPRIASGTQLSTQGVPGAGDTPTVAANKVLSIDIDSVGTSPNEGQDLTVSVGVVYS